MADTTADPRGDSSAEAGFSHHIHTAFHFPDGDSHKTLLQPTEVKIRFPPLLHHQPFTSKLPNERRLAHEDSQAHWQPANRLLQLHVHKFT